MEYNIYVIFQVSEPPSVDERKSNSLDKNTITGLIIIAVVCCIVGTSLVWVVIIYQTRKRRSRSTSDNSDDTTVPLNAGQQGRVSGSQQKIDYISEGSSQSKSDSFLGQLITYM